MADGAQATLHVTVRELSWRQKRELGSLVAAGVASAAFFLVPALELTASLPLLPGSPFTLHIARAPSAPATFTVPPPLPSRGRTMRAPRPSLPHRDAPAMLLTEVAPSLERLETTRKAPGRLTRVLVGDGRYRVQPFPVPSEQN